MQMARSTTWKRRIYNQTGVHYETGRYGEVHMDSYRRFRNETLLNLVREAFGEQNLRVLEVGCGPGPSLDFLARNAGHSLFGLDASETMLRQANHKVADLDERPKLTLGDGVATPFVNGAFDVVFATRFIHQFPHEVKRAIWGELLRILRPGGLLVVEFYARPYHWLRYFTGARKGRSRDDYFSHYPSVGQVRDIVGEETRIIPLRLAGERVWHTLLGRAIVRRATRACAGTVGRIFADEYFVAARKH
jgi:SAM-dependent methyltransferase